MLVGCSYFDTSGHDELVVSKSAGDIAYDVDASGRVAEPVDIGELMAQRTDGSVEIYSLDGAPPVPSVKPVLVQDSVNAAAEVAPVNADPVNVSAMPAVFSADPSVQVFPFEDSFAPSYPAKGAQAPLSRAQPARKEEYVSIAGGGDSKATIYFGHDSAALGSDAMAKIASVASSFNNVSGKGLTIEGHSSIRANYNDAAQRKVVNLKISMDRAFAVAQALIKKGIPAEALRVMAWGDGRPPVRMDGKSVESAARRVEISR